MAASEAMRVIAAPLAVSILQPAIMPSLVSMMAADLTLSGSAQSRVTVPKISASAPRLDEFLLSDDSNQVLLGTPDFRWNGDLDLWECTQAPVEWFSIMLTPLFREVIERPPSSGVDVRVLEAVIEIEDSGKRSALVGRAMGQVMSRAKVTGLNSVRWVESADGWALSGDVTLNLNVSPPRIFPIPRAMFESIGSDIIKTTCKQRGDVFLGELAAGYKAWASSKVGASSG